MTSSSSTLSGLQSGQRWESPPGSPMPSSCLDLDDPAALVHRSIRPSRVVTRDRSTTQHWAAEAYAEAAWSGTSWWSYYDPEWMSLGLWCAPSRGAIDGLDLVDTEEIGAGHPAVAAAEQALLRRWS